VENETYKTKRVNNKTSDEIRLRAALVTGGCSFGAGTSVAAEEIF